MTPVNSLPETTDIAIVGGGMVGLSFAAILANANPTLSVIVIEAAPTLELASNEALATEFPPSFDARSTALSESSRQIYEVAGIWAELSSSLSTIEAIHVSDRGHAGATRLSARESGLKGLGYVVENRVLGKVLISTVKKMANVQLMAPATVDRVVPVAEGMDLYIGNRSCRTRLLAVAGGADSRLLQSLGIHTSVTNYDQSALIANIGLSEPHRGVAFERFTDEGPIALLPLTVAGREHRSALVWTLRPENAEDLLAMDDGEFLRKLHGRFGFRAGRFTRCGNRATYPLSLMVAEEQIRSDLVVLGNAAHFLHPVAGQGFNLALRDVARLSEVILSGVAEGKSPGSLELLDAYFQAQRLDQENTIRFSHNLPAIFSNASASSAVLRNAALITLDLIPPLRQEFGRFGAGLLYRGMKLKARAENGSIDSGI